MKNIKIGILTFHRSYNCGSILQAYALQQAIKYKLNSKPEFIDFSNNGQKKIYSIFNKDFSGKSIIKNIISIIFYKRLRLNNINFNNFINQNLTLSKSKYTNTIELIENKFDYNVYLVGSDQVWNITIADGDDAYFLPFIKKHLKIGYALSLGAKNIFNNTTDPEKYCNMIKEFDYLSFREPNGEKWIKEACGVETTQVLDPTLLLDIKDYEDLEETTVENLSNNEYIFVYATEINKDFESFIINLAKKEKLQIVIWHFHVWIKKYGWLKNYVLPKNQTPGKYLYLIKNAKYVFTSSYHGVIFSIQYKKNFRILHNRGMNYNTDDRIISLIDKFQLNDRLIFEEMNLDIMIKKPNYRYFMKKIKNERKSSYNFLKLSLQAYEQKP